jgi:hypothetical protein
VSQMTIDFESVPRAAQITACANAASHRWCETEAADFAVDYLRTHGSSIAEPVIFAAKEAGLDPGEPRAWGAIFVRLSHAGRIVHDGYGTRFNGNPCKSWRAV